jgi:protein SCO1
MVFFRFQQSALTNIRKCDTMKQNILLFTKLFPIVLLFALQLCLSSCGSKPEAPAASGSAKEYEIKGKVVSVNKSDRKVTVDHEEIPGYMEKMTMEFNLYDDWVYSELAPGAIIQATLVVDGERSWLKNPVVTKITDPSQVGRSEESGIEPDPGTEVPNFALVNQNGRKINFKQYRGRALLVTFIYTRCPLPDYCPLMSQNFAQINRDLAKNTAMKEKTHLLSISIDPDYDKPQVLREYGARYIGSKTSDAFKQWEFASGSPEQIKDVAVFFGLNYWPEKGQVIHGLRTALVTSDGKVFKVYRGNDWKPEEVLKDIEKLQFAG